MVNRYLGETILARWTVDSAALRDFVRETRQRSGASSGVPQELLRECERQATGAGLEIVIREDAVFVGDWGTPNWFSEVEVVGTRVRFLGDEGHQILVPLAPEARAAAERVAAAYAALDAKARAKAQSEFLARRAMPTWNNRILNLTETHFVWILLGLFFAVLPLVLLLLISIRN